MFKLLVSCSLCLSPYIFYPPSQWAQLKTALTLGVFTAAIEASAAARGGKRDPLNYVAGGMVTGLLSSVQQFVNTNSSSSSSSSGRGGFSTSKYSSGGSGSGSGSGSGGGNARAAFGAAAFAKRTAMFTAFGAAYGYLQEGVFGPSAGGGGTDACNAKPHRSMYTEIRDSLFKRRD